MAITGTPTAGIDVLWGDEAPDTIDGLAGNDTLYRVHGHQRLSGRHQ